MAFEKPLPDGTQYYAEQADDIDLGITDAAKTYSGIVGYGSNNKMTVNDDGSIEVNLKALTQAFDSILAYPRGTDPVRRTSTGGVMAFPGKLTRILVESSSSGTITIYDNATTNTGTVILNAFPVTAGQSVDMSNVRLTAGCYVVFGGTVSAAFFYDPTTT